MYFPSNSTETILRVLNKSMQWKIPRPTLEPSHEQSEGRGWRFGLRESGGYGRWMDVSGFLREELLVLWGDGSLQFLLNYSSTGGQGQACSVCSTGTLTHIQFHTYKCNEHKCKLEQRICVLWRNPSLSHIIKAWRFAWKECNCHWCTYPINLDFSSIWSVVQGFTVSTWDTVWNLLLTFGSVLL